MHIYILFGILGAFIGSFAGVIIHRLHFDQPGIIRGRSKCPYCKKKLTAKMLIPIFSWIFLKGKCAFCHKKISFFYPLIELVFGIVFFIFVQKFWSTNIFWIIQINVIFILILFFYDVLYLEVDRRISFPAIFLVFLWSFFREMNFLEFWIGGACGFLFFAIQFYLSKGRWVGAGDQELGLFMGMLLGWKFLFLAFFLAYFLGTIVSIPLLIIKKVTPKTQLPLGAFLMPATLIFLYDGEKIWNFYWEIFIL